MKDGWISPDSGGTNGELIAGEPMKGVHLSEAFIAGEMKEYAVSRNIQRRPDDGTRGKLRLRKGFPLRIIFACAALI